MSIDQCVDPMMYNPYSSSTQRNKSRVYLLIFLVFLLLVVYWRYSSTNNQTFQSVGQQIDHAKHQLDNAGDAAKDKAKEAVGVVQQAADQVKNKL